MIEPKHIPAYARFLNNERKMHWIESGIFYGYPQCCILAFVKSAGKQLTEEQSQVHKGHGFVPCPECSKKIVAGEATLKGLITNRVCKLKFPNDGIDVLVTPHKLISEHNKEVTEIIISAPIFWASIECKTEFSKANPKRKA